MCLFNHHVWCVFVFTFTITWCKCLNFSLTIPAITTDLLYAPILGTVLNEPKETAEGLFSLEIEGRDQGSQGMHSGTPCSIVRAPAAGVIQSVLERTISVALDCGLTYGISLQKYDLIRRPIQSPTNLRSLVGKRVNQGDQIMRLTKREGDTSTFPLHEMLVVTIVLDPRLLLIEYRRRNFRMLEITNNLFLIHGLTAAASTDPNYEHVRVQGCSDPNFHKWIPFARR